MDKKAHTPGPWVFDPSWDILGNTNDGNGLVCQITHDRVDREEAEANAYLVKAAPDLLKALEIARSAINCVRRPTTDPADERLFQGTLRRIEAAISKATGGE
ncbi:hypothetical protein GN330_22870 [Nitratireductor sp. CAU 1489]|uniref:Uncharacterized protein n=1 Tax=Nitratireductor arenosus TaxID=2682096 RepID=A0A844QKD4_9HYPH|nr:hypothetical protein [Nitratireductor arenosus]MVB00093.1 hypothetical protein [Nitratireductor arenosus]